MKVPFGRKSTQAFIMQVKNAPSAEQERSIVATESAKIRNDFGQAQYDNLQDNLTKLIFIYLLGYPSHFGQMACLQLISKQGYNDKRIGYLAMDLFLCDTNDILLLTVNSIKNDIRNMNPYIVSLALTFCGNRCNEPLARDVFPEVIPLYSSDNPYIRKKACLASIKLISIVPDLLDDMVRSLPTLLNDDNHGVFVSAIQLTKETLRIAPTYIPRFRKLIPRLCKRLRSVISGNGKSECYVGSVPDPFVQTQLLQLLHLLAENDDESTEIVMDTVSLITSKVDSTSTAGNAVLYEAVRTIVSLNVTSAHLVEAAGILNRFLLNNQADIRYVSLSLMNQMISIDDSIVARYRATILSCLREDDPSIRRRALDIIIALVRLNNVEELVRELLQFMTETEDNEERNELISKITSLVQQFSPSPIWQVDTLIAILRMSGKQNNDEVLPTFVEVVGHEKDHLACYTVHRLYEDLHMKNVTVALLQTAIWFIGEYGDLLLEEYKDDETVNRNYGKKNKSTTPLMEYKPVTSKEIVQTLETLSSDSSLSIDTVMLLLMCCLKVSTRLDEDCIPAIKKIITKYQSSTDIEVQQRACEFASLLEEDMENVLDPLLDRMPPLDIDTARMLRLENEEQQEEETTSSYEEEESEYSSDEEENVEELLGYMKETPADPVEKPRVQQYDFIAYQNNHITIQFKTKEGNNKNETIVKAVISNQSSIDIEDFEMLIVVPKYMQIQMKPLSCNVLPAVSGVSTQLFRLRNNMMEEKDTVVKMRILYRIGEEEVDESVMVDKFHNE